VVSGAVPLEKIALTFRHIVIGIRKIQRGRALILDI
jgi:hypothetical protein